MAGSWRREKNLKDLTLNELAGAEASLRAIVPSFVGAAADGRVA
jgi:hypothetical protein